MAKKQAGKNKKVKEGCPYKAKGLPCPNLPKIGKIQSQVITDSPEIVHVVPPGQESTIITVPVPTQKDDPVPSEPEERDEL
jgi:hypothetical protein